MAHFHDKVGRDGWQQFWPIVIQTQRHTMGAVCVNHALRGPAARRVVGGLVNFAVQRHRFAGALATQLLTLCIQQGQIGGF